MADTPATPVRHRRPLPPSDSAHASPVPVKRKVAESVVEGGKPRAAMPLAPAPLLLAIGALLGALLLLAGQALVPRQPAGAAVPAYELPVLIWAPEPNRRPKAEDVELPFQNS